jgi:predicted Zn-dependent protease
MILILVSRRARNLRSFDEHYDEALSIAEPLVARYPRNPVFQLLAGDLNAELGRDAKASEYFHAVLAPSPDSDPDSACAARPRALATSFLSSLK